MTSRQIELFLSVAKHLNFTKASEENHVSQPTASRQIAQLEEEWGVELFYRSQNIVRLTAAGAALAKELTRMQGEFDSVLAAARDTRGAISGSLSIGYLSYLNTDIFVYPLVEEFKKRYPHVKVTARPAVFSVLGRGLTHGEFDVIFIYSLDLCFVRRVRHINCCPVSHMIAMSSAHPLASKKDIKPSDLSGETFLLEESKWRKSRENDVLAVCRQCGIQDVHFGSAGSVEDVIAQVRNGVGVALVTSDNPCFFDSRYVCVPVPDPGAVNYIAAVWNTVCRDPVVLAFTDLAAQRVSAQGHV